jgi:hypothetical protein
MRRLIVLAHEHADTLQLDVDRTGFAMLIVARIELVHLESDPELDRVVIILEQRLSRLGKRRRIRWRQDLVDWLEKDILGVATVMQ